MDLVLFAIVAGVTLLSAMGVVVTRNVVYAALCLLGALLGVAGLFVLLYAEFLALVQLFIYGGAIIIVILFALMLTRTGEFQTSSENRRWPVAALVSGGLFVLLAVIFTTDTSARADGERTGILMSELGVTLFEDWAIPFEIASLVLLVALVGAVVLSRTADNGAQEDEPIAEDALPAETPRPAARAVNDEQRELAATARRRSREGGK